MASILGIIVSFYGMYLFHTSKGLGLIIIGIGLWLLPDGYDKLGCLLLGGVPFIIGIVVLLYELELFNIDSSIVWATAVIIILFFILYTAATMNSRVNMGTNFVNRESICEADWSRYI